jgi:hypothetical protein
LEFFEVNVDWLLFESGDSGNIPSAKVLFHQVGNYSRKYRGGGASKYWLGISNLYIPFFLNPG